MTEQSVHRSVLTAEVLELIQPKSGRIYLDGTFGGGGHSHALLEASSPQGRVVALDRDPAVQVYAEPLLGKYASRFAFETRRYDQVGLLDLSFDGVVLDLGLSTDQLENLSAGGARGFSYHRNEPLDMRYDARGGQTASQLLNQTSLPELARIFREYGEDRQSALLARKITAKRKIKPISTTFDLVSVIGTTEPKVLSRIFQAVRIAVNDELNRLRQGLVAVAEDLKPNGVLAVISFHSLEDRIVKNFVRDSLEPMTKKPIIATDEEITNNPRARCAKLRAGKRKAVF